MFNRDSFVVVEVPFRSDSLHFRPYAVRLGASSVLDWVIQRLQPIATGAANVYLLAERTELRHIERAVTLGVSVWPASGRGQLRDLEAMTRVTGKSRLLLVDLTAALLPQELLNRLVRDHVASGNQATTLVALPCADPPVVVEAEMLSTLVESFSGVAAHLMPQDLRLALAAMDRAVRAADNRKAVRLERLVLLTAEEQRERGWPYAVRLWERDDVEVLRRVVNQHVDSPGNLEADVDPLDRWADAEVECEKARVADLHVPPPDAERSSARRILYVQSPSAFTGVEQVLVQLAGAIGGELVQPFHAAALIALDGVLTDRLTGVGVDVHVAHRDFALGSVEHYLLGCRMLRKIRPALVHAHTLAGVPFCCAIAESRIPFVQHVHVASQGALAQLRDQIAFASAVIAVSEFVKRQLIRLGIDADKVCVIRNGVRLAAAENTLSPVRDVARARTRQACGVPEDAPVVLMPARFASSKRHDVALVAFAQLRGRLPAARLLFAGEALVGDQPTLRAIETRIDQLHLRDHVHRLGFWRDMPALYAASDVLVLPSEHDPLPLTVLEGMAAGVPVVAARSGGIPEMIEQGTSGLLIEPGDADGLATALAQVLTEEERRKQLVAGGLARCHAEFTLSRFVGDVARLYEQLLASEHVAAGHR